MTQYLSLSCPRNATLSKRHCFEPFAARVQVLCLKIIGLTSSSSPPFPGLFFIGLRDPKGPPHENGPTHGTSPVNISRGPPAHNNHNPQMQPTTAFKVSGNFVWKCQHGRLHRGGSVGRAISSQVSLEGGPGSREDFPREVLGPSDSKIPSNPINFKGCGPAEIRCTIYVWRELPSRVP